MVKMALGEPPGTEAAMRMPTAGRSGEQGWKDQWEVCRRANCGPVMGSGSDANAAQRLSHTEAAHAMPHPAPEAKAQHTLQATNSQTNMRAALSTEPHLRPMRSHTKPMPCGSEGAGGDGCEAASQSEGSSGSRHSNRPGGQGDAGMAMQRVWTSQAG